MAKKGRNTGADIDWYLISIDRLKQIGLVVLLLLLGVAGWWFYRNQHGNPKTMAESAIGDARQALNQLAASKDYPQHQQEFQRAQRKLEDANAHLAANRFDDARESAVESQTISRTALSGGLDRENDAQFLTVEGDVKYQKGSAGEWRDADPRAPLFNGDWVKTGDHASAELIFSNGSLYTIGPSALLEIYAVMNPATSRKQNAVQMKVGSVEVATSDDPSAVHTPGTQVTIDSDSTTQVGVDQAQATQIVSTRGSASVAPEKGGSGVKLGQGEKVSGSADGGLSAVKKLMMPPGLLSPADNQVFQLTPGLKVDLVWDAQPGATGYVLQASRSRLFATLEINSKRTKPSAPTSITDEGAFYWRVASIGPDGEVGPFSSFRRFRVTSGATNGVNATTGADKTAPVLKLKPPFHYGGQFYLIAGSTEPGATVFVNDEEVDVNSSGAFQKLVSFDKVGRNAVIVKAVDAAGNQTVQSQTVIVEE